MGTKVLYKSVIKSGRYVFRDGKVLEFRDHYAIVHDDKHKAELDSDIENGDQPFISIATDKTVEVFEDPMHDVKVEAKAPLLAEIESLRAQLAEALAVNVDKLPEVAVASKDTDVVALM